MRGLATLMGEEGGNETDTGGMAGWEGVFVDGGERCARQGGVVMRAFAADEGF